MKIKSLSESSICPECKEEIDYLYCRESNVVINYTISLNFTRDNLEWEEGERDNYIPEFVFSCPCCDEDIFNDEEDALNFLKRQMK